MLFQVLGLPGPPPGSKEAPQESRYNASWGGAISLVSGGLWWRFCALLWCSWRCPMLPQEMRYAGVCGSVPPGVMSVALCPDVMLVAFLPLA